MHRHAAKWSVVFLLAACSAAPPETDDRPAAHVERDVASVDTTVRMRALGEARILANADARRRIFIALAHDADPRIRGDALQCAEVWAKGPEATAAVVRGLDDTDTWVKNAATWAALHLSDEDIRLVPLDRLTALLPAAANVSDDVALERVLSLIDRQIETGVAVPASAILASALEARSVSGRDASLACADRATTVAPLSSADIPLLRALLAREDTRDETIGLLARARGAIGWRLLLELEATTHDASERDRARAALAHHEGHARELHAVIEAAATNAADERVRDLARRRLTDW